MVLLLCALGLPAPGGGGPAEGPEEQAVESREAELEAVRTRIAEVQRLLRSAEGERRVLSDELEQTERRIGASARRLRVLAGRLEAHAAELAALEKRRALQQQRLAVHRETLARQVRAAYAMGRQERLKILLNQQDPAMVSRVMVYYDYFNRARAEQVREVQKGLEQLSQTEEAIRSQREQLLVLSSRELDEKQALEEARARRSEVLAALDREIRTGAEQLADLRKNEQSLQTLVEELRAALAAIPAEIGDRPPFAAQRGRLAWPAGGRLAARYGAPRQVGELRWDGVLISAPEGQEVKAVYHGRVAFADWLRGFGLLLIIDHGDGYMSLYGHNQSLFKETGEWVEAGEPVALVGASGGRASPGVYFAIRYQGRPVDPGVWCRAAQGGRIG
jgi:septal ring factor EnvC (AmiA/AmiB activator)